MALNKVSANSTEKFENNLGSTLVMDTTKTTTKSNVTIHSRVKKGDEEVGTISYESDGGYLIVDIKKFKTLSKAEAQSILAAASEDIVGEVYADEEDNSEAAETVG